MDYLAILLNSFLDNPKYFKANLIREQKKAKQNLVEIDEFYSRCIDVSKHLDSILEEKLNERKRKLYFMLDRAKSRTSIFSDKSQDSNLTYEEQCDQLIKYCQQELENISKDNFFINLNSLTKGQFIGQLSNNQVNNMKLGIVETIESILPKKEEPNYKNQAWFLVGLKFADGSLVKLIKEKGYSFEKATETLFPGEKVSKYRPYISSSYNGNETKNIFLDSSNIDLIIEHCKENNIDISEDFYSRTLP